MSHPSPNWPRRAVFAAGLFCAVLAWSGCQAGSTASAKSAQANPQSNSPASAQATANPANAAPSNPQAAANPAASGSSTAPGGSNSAQASSNPATNPAPAKPAPAKPLPVTLTVGSGTIIPLRLDHTLSTRTATVGETFTGTLYAPLLDSTGAVAFPKGTSASGTVVASKNKGRFKGAGFLALRLDQIGGQSVRTSEYEVTSKGKGKRTAGFIGGGAGGGAVIGAMAGGGMGALAGTLIGGGAGTVGAAFTGNKPVVIPAETKLRFKLTGDVKVVVPR